MSEIDRDALGRLVREVWITWAREQPDPKPSWLTPWEVLTEIDREVDRLIGERLYDAGWDAARTGRWRRRRGRGRDDGRGDLVWLEERVRRECAELRRTHRSSLEVRGVVRAVGGRDEAYCVHDGQAWPCTVDQTVAGWCADPRPGAVVVTIGAPDETRVSVVTACWRPPSLHPHAGPCYSERPDA